MTVTREASPVERYIGVSTDSKPTTGVTTGAQFLETDTGDTYTWDGSNWKKVFFFQSKRED